MMNEDLARQFTWDMMILCGRMNRRIERNVFKEAHRSVLQEYGHR